jgi:hypothetical protein
VPFRRRQSRWLGARVALAGRTARRRAGPSRRPAAKASQDMSAGRGPWAAWGAPGKASPHAPFVVLLQQLRHKKKRGPVGGSAGGVARSSSPSSFQSPSIAVAAHPRVGHIEAVPASVRHWKASRTPRYTFSSHPKLTISRATHSHALSCLCLTRVAPTIFCPRNAGLANGPIHTSATTVRPHPDVTGVLHATVSLNGS